MSQTAVWTVFGVLVAGILCFDLLVLGHRRRALGPRRALLVVAAYALIAIGFGLMLLSTAGPDAALEFFTAYLLEQSLSFDNIFVWLLIFENLQINERAEQKVLFWGILGAMLFRGAFIFLGAALLSHIHWLLYLFGVLVIFSGWRMLRSKGTTDISQSRIFRFARAHLPVSASAPDRAFFTRVDGRLLATPLFLAVVVIEATDLVFALDSIPAIFGVTRDPLIVYTSNIFAIVGLRALYFVISGLIEELRYMRFGLAILLVLIGLRMIAGPLVELPAWTMLLATIVVIGSTVAASLWARRTQPCSARSNAAFPSRSNRGGR